MGLFSWLFPSDNSRSIKKLKKIADKVIELEEKYKAMSDDELKLQTEVLKNKLFEGKTLEEVQAMENYAWGIADTSIISVAD